MSAPVQDVRKLTPEEYRAVKAQAMRAEYTDKNKREDARQLAAVRAKHPDLVPKPKADVLAAGVTPGLSKISD